MNGATDEPREGASGWIQVGCGTAMVMGLPLWFGMTSLILRGNEAWRELPANIGVPIAAGVAAFWLGVGGVMIAAVLLFARGLSRLGAARAASQRAHYDSLVGDAAALPADSWGVTQSQAATGGSESGMLTDHERPGAMTVISSAVAELRGNLGGAVLAGLLFGPAMVLLILGALMTGYMPVFVVAVSGNLQLLMIGTMMSLALVVVTMSLAVLVGQPLMQASLHRAAYSQHTGGNGYRALSAFDDAFDRAGDVAITNFFVQVVVATGSLVLPVPIVLAALTMNDPRMQVVLLALAALLTIPGTLLGIVMPSATALVSTRGYGPREALDTVLDDAMMRPFWYAGIGLLGMLTVFILSVVPLASVLAPAFVATLQIQILAAAFPEQADLAVPEDAPESVADASAPAIPQVAVEPTDEPDAPARVEPAVAVADAADEPLAAEDFTETDAATEEADW